MRRWTIWLLLMGLLAHPVTAVAGDWPRDREIHCRDHLSGCRILQMVMTGAFDDAEHQDPVTERVLAAAWPRLLEVTEADLAHFSEEFLEDIEQTRTQWYEAMAGCLCAFIHQKAQPSPQQELLALFLDDSDAVEAKRERERIRRDMTEAALRDIAADIDAPVEFVQWLIYGRA